MIDDILCEIYKKFCLDDNNFKLKLTPKSIRIEKIKLDRTLKGNHTQRTLCSNRRYNKQIRLFDRRGMFHTGVQRSDKGFETNFEENDIVRFYMK
ncbi:hypothetical protein [uncultured Anaerofustis sp.]|uniref:hypothetical protein n=1 Tax=uncultured Anaerofustis sp. TaxID=904996 RepID=UPI0025E6068D|nr:hypothetical protein [uncultured Anaerofustis sp.]